MEIRILLCLILFTSIGNASIAQKAKSKDVATRYISFPEFNVKGKSSADFVAQMAFENSEYAKGEMFTDDAVCTLANSEAKDLLKNSKSIPLYFYSIDVTRGRGFFVIKDRSEKIYYAEALFKEDFSNRTPPRKLIYGKKDCKFWMEQLLVEDFKKNKDKWEADEFKQFLKNQKNRLEQILKTKFVLGYVSENITVYTGKGKKYDYSELDRTQQQAMQAYRSINKKGINQASMDQLNEPIQIWASTVEKVNWEDKKAQFNHRIGKGLLYNLAVAYFYQGDMEKTMSYAARADEVFGNFSNDFRLKIKALIQLARIQKVGRAANQNLLADYALLHQKASVRSGEMAKVEVLGRAEIPRLDFQHDEYEKKMGKAAEVAKVETIRANGGNPYEHKIQPSFKGQKTLVIAFYDEELTAIPPEIFELDLDALLLGEQSIQSIPDEIGSMTGLKVLDLSGNKFESVPSAIGNCTNLKELNLSRNNISSLPETIQNLKKLKILKIKKTKIPATEMDKIKSWLPPGCKIKI